MLLKSREDIEADLVLDAAKVHKNVHLYLESIGWEGSAKDYIDVEFLSQKESTTSHFVSGGLILVGFIGLMIFGVNITGNAVDDSVVSGAASSFIGLFLLLLGVLGLIIKFRK